MGYSKYTLKTFIKTFQLTQQRQPLFDHVPDIEPDAWLSETLRKGMELVIDTEKARSELIVMPILLSTRERNQHRFAIYSGETFDVDSTQDLNGECDFILTYTPPLPSIQAPIIMMIEAKDHNIEGFLGQCGAQMMAARLFNHHDQVELDSMFGCVTTGEAWQFLKLTQDSITIDKHRYYIDNLPQILGVLQVIINLYTTQLEKG